ncbi:flagellar hook-basal body protein [Acetobacterium malicum]|uniref:Flagellar hook-basal body complex protein n=1 Tax=Acetobacterium malicum TaxID=52692 RepID=A0ABR6YV60_9FIRM|nr:flagellar hook-basal body protein [Acetobacterium malicum]MBC3899081.1 flagellar hook-basal body complex protein [Acetobacterium malicum]
MIRGFYASKLGMIAQQNSLNTIANNVANINTIGFKPQVTAFSSLLYENIDGGGGAEISTGHGAKVQKIGIDFTQGFLQPTGRTLDCAIEGAGFFAIQNKETNTTTYTRDGVFHISVEGDQSFLVDARGNYVLGQDNNPLNITGGFDSANLGVFSFANPYGLTLLGSNQFAVSDLSGQPAADNVSIVRNGYLESSATDSATEMVKMLEANRAFSFNSRIVQSTDEMEKTVNQLR